MPLKSSTLKLFVVTKVRLSQSHVIMLHTVYPYIDRSFWVRCTNMIPFTQKTRCPWSIYIYVIPPGSICFTWGKI